MGETLPRPRTWGSSDDPGDGVTPRKAQKGIHPEGPWAGHLRSLYVNSSLQSVGDRRQLTGLQQGLESKGCRRCSNAHCAWGSSSQRPYEVDAVMSPFYRGANGDTELRGLRPESNF